MDGSVDLIQPLFAFILYCIDSDTFTSAKRKEEREEEEEEEGRRETEIEKAVTGDMILSLYLLPLISLWRNFSEKSSIQLD